MDTSMETISWADFAKIELRVGTVVDVQDFPEARKPAYIVVVDFGPEIGFKKSSVQITTLYRKEDLVGRQVLGVVNFPPRQIGPVHSEVLTLGFEDAEGAIVLAQPGMAVPEGRKLL